MLDLSYYDHLPDYGDLPPVPAPAQTITPKPSWHPRPAHAYTLITCTSLEQAAHVVHALKHYGRADTWRMRSDYHQTLILLEHPAKVVPMPVQLDLFAA